MPNLLRWQGLEVYEYICTLAALHLRQTRRLQDLGEMKIVTIQMQSSTFLTGEKIEPLEKKERRNRSSFLLFCDKKRPIILIDD